MMIGILTDAWTGKRSNIELDYKIVEDDEGRRMFNLIGGPTGYESFYIDYEAINPFIDAFHTDIKKLAKTGWIACMGTKNSWDKLLIPAIEMKKVFELEGLICDCKSVSCPICNPQYNSDPNQIGGP